AASGGKESRRREFAAERRRGRRVPPALEHGCINAAEVERITRVAVAAETIERWRLAIAPPRHPTAQRKVNVGGAVIGPVRQILPWAPAEFGIRQHEGVLPAPELVERCTERDNALREIRQEPG